MASPFLERPAEFSFRAIDLRVAFAPAGTTFDWAWASVELGDLGYRARVEEVKAGINEDFPRCRIALNLAAEYTGDAVELAPALPMGAFNKVVHPDTLLVVWAELPAEVEDGGEPSRRFLFAGYPNVQSLRFSGASSGEGVEISLECTSLLERLAREPAAWIAGRYLPRPNPPAGEHDYQLCAALPCIFNFHGRPNRHADLLANVNGLADVPCFTYDGDPAATAWKVADVLRYLLAFYHAALGEDYFLKDGNGGTFTAAIVAANGDPEEVDDPDDMTFDEILRTSADELTCEAMDLTRALLLLCKTAGMGMMQWALNETGDGEPAAKLLFWGLAEGGPWQSAGLGDERLIRTSDADPLLAVGYLLLEPEGSTIAGRRADQIFNDVHTGDLKSDASTVLASVEVRGDIHEYEVTVGHGVASKPADVLKPLWAPDTVFGDNQASGAALDQKISDIAAVAKDATGTPLTMFQRYVSSGALHQTYKNVGRLWGLNEAGEYAGASYGRTNGSGTAWNAAKYDTPYNFHANASCPRMQGSNAEGEAVEIDWLARRRRFLRPLSRFGAQKAEIRPIVLASWDSGSHWYEYPGNVTFLEDQCALRVTDANLANVKNEGATSVADFGGGHSVWEAIVRGTFRLAVTATIEGDERVVARASTQQAFTTFSPHRTVNARELFKFRKRTASSRCVGDASYSFSDVDDTAQTLTLARRFLGVAQARLVAGTVVSPWARIDWLPGDRVRGIQPRGIEFAATKSEQDNAKRWPQVVETVWVNSEANQVTRLTLDDRRRSLTQAAQAEIS